MKPLNVDLRRRSTPRVVQGLVLVAGTVGTLALWAGVIDATNRLGELNARRDGLMREVASKTAESLPASREPSAAKPHEKARVASPSDWPAMLTALETVDMAGVDLVTVEIVRAERSIHVDAEFVDFATLLRYVDELNAGEPLPRWAITQAVIGPGGGTGTRAVAVAGLVRATW